MSTANQHEPTTDAVEILRRDLIGSDPQAAAEYEQAKADLAVEARTHPSEPVASLIMITSDRQRQQRLELLRWMLLQEARKASARGLPVSTYHLAVHLRGLDSTREEVEREIDYLVGRKLLATVSKTISPEVAWYRIRAEGIGLLIEHRLDG